MHSLFLVSPPIGRERDSNYFRKIKKREQRQGEEA